MNNGKEFESLVVKIYNSLKKQPEHENIQHNIRLKGKDGYRQIDILITSQIANFDIKTIIECKDYSKKVDVKTIDALHSLLQDVNANKGVVISRKGFTKTAINKAKRLGILLCTAHEALSKKWGIVGEVPILITKMEIGPISIKHDLPEGGFSKEVTLKKEDCVVINNVDTFQEFRNYWNSKDITPEEIAENSHRFILHNVNKPYLIKDVNGNYHEIADFYFSYQIEKTYYFGYLDKIKDSLLLVDLINNTHTITFSNEILFNYETRLHKISKNEIPNFKTIEVQIIVKPELTDHFMKTFDVSFQKSND